MSNCRLLQLMIHLTVVLLQFETMKMSLLKTISTPPQKKKKKKVECVPWFWGVYKNSINILKKIFHENLTNE